MSLHVSKIFVCCAFHLSEYLFCILSIAIEISPLCQYRASLGWFAYGPEWYDVNNLSFAQSEAQSVSVFLDYLLNERGDAGLSDSKGRVRENGSTVGDVVR